MAFIVANCANRTCSHKAFRGYEDDGPKESEVLTASVGEGCRNVDADVRNVQTRLNRVSSEAGGPYQKLKVDGACGSRTKAAIFHFQQRYWQELLGDSRIDPGQSTWKKLLQLSGSPEAPAFSASAAGAGPSAGSGTDEATQLLFAQLLYLSRWRVYDAITCIDAAKADLSKLVLYMVTNNKTSIYAAYMSVGYDFIPELRTFDRCFHPISREYAAVDRIHQVLARVRTVYVAMLDVITRSSFTTPAAELDGSRRFLRVVEQEVLDKAHPDKAKGVVVADAVAGGWKDEDANKAHMRYGTGYLDYSRALTVLVHEMSHFVAGPANYDIMDDGGYGYDALKVTHDTAVRTAECYAWYALLSHHKRLRSLPDYSLPLDL